MRIPTKKLNNGFEMPVLGFGTWEIGGMFEKEKDHNEEKDILAIRKAVELGCNRFDTAEIYAGGYAEEILGKAVGSFDRAKLFITSKVHKTHLKYDDVLKSCENSLKRLGLDFLDLYLIHSPNPDISIEETMKAFDKLKKEGLIKNIGVSNFEVETFEKAQSFSENKIVLNQVHYNLIFREPVIAGVLDYCQNNDVILEAWRPVQQGSLCKPGITVLDEMAKKYGKTQPQIAINWLISQKNVVTLFKTSDINHLEENLNAGGWQISDEDIKFLAKEFPIQLDRSNAVRLG